MKLNKKQLDVFFHVCTSTKTADTFWEMLLGEDHDHGYNTSKGTSYSTVDLKNCASSRKGLVDALRQLADTVEVSPPKLHPDCADAQMAKNKGKDKK